MSSLKNAINAALKSYFDLKKHEKFLVVYDIKKEKLAKYVFEESKKYTDFTKLLKIEEPKVSGEEPSSEVAEEMMQSDVIMIMTSKSLSHTKSRIKASRNGARIASMPKITEDMFVRTITFDYEKMKERTERLTSILTKSKFIHITTAAGTDLKMDTSGRQGFGGILLREKGDFHNLPCGEASLSPNEGTTNGVLVVDASFLEKVDEPIRLVIKDGYAIEIKGGEVASKLKKELDSVNDKDAYAVAELGIGTNDKAKVIGKILEDEKVLGTAHVALGNNLSYHGKLSVPIHLDGVFYKPTIIVDNVIIIEKGKFLI
jgi:leucyl aminopeptidase (aminopeptidase T)